MDKEEFKELINEFIGENCTSTGNEQNGIEIIPQDDKTYHKEMDELYDDICGCKSCKYLMELFKRIEKSTNRDYWLMTELFVLLHDGKDYCDISKRKSIYIESDETNYNPFPKKIED